MRGVVRCERVPANIWLPRVGGSLAPASRLPQRPPPLYPAARDGAHGDGIRPTEVSRIDPERDIDWQNQRVVVRPTTSKTGGGRVVPLRCGNIDALRHDIPRRWVHRWRALRKAAGWSKETARPWRQDVCRHTFATYHAAHFRNFPALQLEMGHRDSNLLRTRYVYAGNSTEATARSYFRV